ncbi:MAG: chloride channel protein, partial [Candidatus Sericytochromatia bacterium]
GWIGTWRNHVGLSPEAWYEWAYLPFIGFVGGAIAGHVVQRFAPEARGSGIPYTQLALARPGTPLRRRAIWVKAVGASVGIGSGLSLGREGPTVQIGAGLGAWVSSWSKRSFIHRRQLIASGAGAGIAAAFNAPIAGVLFVLEGMIKDFSSFTLGSAILATVTAAVVARLLGGEAFIYPIAEAVFEGPELPLYLLIGLAAGMLGPLFVKGVLKALDFSDEQAVRLPKAWHPAVVGFMTGCVGLFFPQVMGGSYSLVEGSLFATIAFWTIPFILISKMALTILAYGSGAPGGIFAPSLVIGALLGLAIGKLAVLVVPFLTLSPAGFAFAGMGAFFAAVSRTPVTAIVIVFELTGNYTQILPLMLAVITASLVAERLHSPSIYSALLKRDGVELEEGPEQLRLGAIPVRLAMTVNLETIPGSAPLSQVAETFARSVHSGFPLVDDEGRLEGIITKADLRHALDEKLPLETLARQIGGVPCRVITPEHSLADAWRKLYRLGIGRLVVVDASDPTRLVGLLTRADILQTTGAFFDQPTG